VVEAEEIAPSTTKRSREMLRRVAVSLSTSPRRSADDAEGDVLWIQVDRDAPSRLRGSVKTLFRPDEFWPDSIEVEPPPFEAWVQLQDLLDREAEHQPVSFDEVDAWVEGALAEGVMAAGGEGDAVEPWHGLLQLEVERRRADCVSLHAFVERQAEIAETLERGERPSAAARAELSRLLDALPPADYGPLLELVDVFSEAHEDHPAWAFYQLYRIAALSQINSTSLDEGGAVDVLEDLLARSTDDLLLSAAAGRVANLGGAQLEGADLRSVRASAEGAGDSGLLLPLFLLQQALDVGEAEVARWAFQRVKDVLTKSLRDNLEARTALLDGGAVSRWEVEVLVEVHRCLEGVPRAPDTLSGEWSDDTWAWSGQTSDFLTCLDSSSPGPPHPPDGQRVRLVFRDLQWSGGVIGGPALSVPGR